MIFERMKGFLLKKVIISGNDKTKDTVIRRELLFFPGERLDTEKSPYQRTKVNRYRVL